MRIATQNMFRQSFHQWRWIFSEAPDLNSNFLCLGRLLNVYCLHLNWMRRDIVTDKVCFATIHTVSAPQNLNFVLRGRMNKWIEMKCQRTLIWEHRDLALLNVASRRSEWLYISNFQHTYGVNCLVTSFSAGLRKASRVFIYESKLFSKEISLGTVRWWNMS